MPIASSSRSVRCRRWRLAVAALGSGALFACGHARAQTAESATSSAINVIETSGAYTSQYLDFGYSNTYPSFALFDFSTSSFGLSYPVASVSSVTLTVTESQYAGSKQGGFLIDLTENTAPVATANNGSKLTYMTGGAPTGFGTQLGDSSSLFQVGSYMSDSATANTSPAAVDTFNLTLTGSALTYFVNQLNTSGGDIRLALASTDTSGYSSFARAGVTLAFNATFNAPTLAWTPGGSGNTNGGAGTWQPAGTAGDTSWNGGAWNSTDVAVFGGTGGQVSIGTGGVSATGIQFNATGYTLGTTGGPAITLTSSSGSSPASIQVTNSTDTATINAPLASTVGINKTGAGTLVLGGANTYMGGTTITAGTLQVSADANLGNASGGVTLASGTLHTTAGFASARAFSGVGTVQIDGSGNTLSTTGVVNMTNLTLSGTGTFALLNSSSSLGTSPNAYSNAVSGTLTFSTAGAVLTASSSGSSPSDGQGVIGLGGVSATQASGTVTLAANSIVTGTVTANVANSGATLNLTGGLAGAAVIAKTGAGTLVLGGDNSGLTGTGTTPTSFRQGTAGATPASGGIVSIAAGNPNPGAALGTGLFDANGGTISNDSGAAVTLAVSGISVGAQNATGTPGGLVFAGANAITVTGPISLYRGGSTAYQHAITVNTPTTFTGMLTADTAANTSTGLTILGSSTLTLAGTAANTLTEPVTIATTGAGGVIAAADGTFAADTSITLNANAKLTLSTGNTINDAAVLLFQNASTTFGKLVLNNTSTETIGGLYLAAGDGMLGSGYLPAGTYGSSSSNAQYKDNTLFSGTGTITNLGVATVPEPSTWAAVLGGLGVLALIRRRRAVRQK